ncbi:hypothetical protein NPS49_05335 [Pseudomonas putida]|uniref:hypothetical protein n=1 Tax=Pseudomonas putida TaxID=303 RepID=UPI002364958C|nr:hypothetical protein [Pseudomonas putida]MDD2067741.1 hypothetical protein [Pseudomonas putida]HDS1738370.1 hypothetical protein [Pseudomonas putida]
MTDSKKSASEEWLYANAPGFSKLPDQDRRAIFDFSFLWSLFEAQVMDNFAQARTISDRVHGWGSENRIYPDVYGEALAYFRSRYSLNGETTHHFDHLNLRGSDHPELIRRVIIGQSDDPLDSMLCTLIIVWRLRNNLFHGTKWSYQIRGQLDNFTHANLVLMKVLERYGRL